MKMLAGCISVSLIFPPKKIVLCAADTIACIVVRKLAVLFIKPSAMKVVQIPRMERVNSRGARDN